MTGKHYKENGIDLFEACEQGLFSQKKYIGFLEMNIVKYLMRYEYKDGLNDLHKAKYYLDELITVVRESKRLRIEEE